MQRELVPWVLLGIGVVTEVGNVVVLVRVLAGAGPSPIFGLPIIFYAGAGLLWFRSGVGPPIWWGIGLCGVHVLLVGLAAMVVRRRADSARRHD